MPGNAEIGKVLPDPVTGNPCLPGLWIQDVVDSLACHHDGASQIVIGFRFSPIGWDLGHSVYRGLRTIFIARHGARLCCLETFRALCAQAAYRKSVLSGANSFRPVLWMAVGSPIQSHCHALDLDSSIGNPNLCLRCYTCPEPMAINTCTAPYSSVPAFVLLWLGLSATGSLLRPIADYDAVLCLGRVFVRRAAGSKCLHEGPEKT
jgi:hypothetical protein